MPYTLQLRLTPAVAYQRRALFDRVANEIGVKVGAINDVVVRRRSIDARRGGVKINLTVDAYVGEAVLKDVFEPIPYPNVEGRPAVIVVGAGPGGLFAALRLIELGLRPIVLERGSDVHNRKKDLAQISRSHRVNPDSNYAFGEGGAGAYSDGKLYTRSKKRGSTEKILRVFCQHGASTDILVDAHPHIGTDRLPRVIERMRHQIVASGGGVHFQTKVTGLISEGGRCVGVRTQTAIAEGETKDVEYRGAGVILATGHSARDVYRFLYNNICMEAKGFAVGVRLEHPSALIDSIQYHSAQGRGQYLPAAEYSFVQQVEGRGVYSFCMCPGGFVVPAASDAEQVVVNGMSPSGRNGAWSNSGMVVEVRPEDVATMGLQADRAAPAPLQMLQFQEELERLAWQQGGRRQTAPAQRMTDFVRGRLSADLPASSYAPGLVASPLHFWLPRPISMRLQAAFQAFGRKSHGFLTQEASVIGVETRTSSPIRLVRDAETLCSVSLKGLYPCGEGAGYAGGIVSAAIDGERCAEAVARDVFSV